MVLAAVAIVVTTAIVAWPSSSSAQAQQLARTNRACQMWASNAQTPSTWCADMRRWMHDQLTEGKATGPTMWSAPTAMRDACRRWLHDTNNTSDLPLCDQMVQWMTNHAGNWNGWMMHGGGMMGAGSP